MIKVIKFIIQNRCKTLRVIINNFLKLSMDLNNSTKKLLKNLLEQIIQEGRHDKEYLYHWKISLNQDIESMHKSLKEMFLCCDSLLPGV